MGTYLFNMFLTNQSNLTTLLILSVSGINWILPTDKINKELFPLASIDETLTYREAESEFDTVYFFIKKIMF